MGPIPKRNRINTREASHQRILIVYRSLRVLQQLKKWKQIKVKNIYRQIRNQSHIKIHTWKVCFISPTSWAKSLTKKRVGELWLRRKRAISLIGRQKIKAKTIKMKVSKINTNSSTLKTFWGPPLFKAMFIDFLCLYYLIKFSIYYHFLSPCT